MTCGGGIRGCLTTAVAVLAAAPAVLLAAPAGAGEVDALHGRVCGISRGGSPYPPRGEPAFARCSTRRVPVRQAQGRLRPAAQTVVSPLPHRLAGAQPKADKAGTTEAGRRLYSLPEDYRGPLGTFNQATLVAHQKTRLGAINTRLSLPLRMSETGHYLLFSDADSATTTRFAAWSEALYESLLKQFGLSQRTRVWDGKCVVILFRRRRAFERYADTFDGHDARTAGAYFAVEDHGPGLPHLVHLCFPLDTRDVRRQQELLAHEGTHAFFELYKTPGRLPLWLHEGLAEYMTTVNDRALGPPKRLRATRVAAAGKPIAPLFDAKPGQDLSRDQYDVALTLVDFLLAEGRPTFKTFIDGLKDGADQAAALQKAYGFDFAELERRWRKHLRRTPPGR
jgi:hypothetical protein